MKITLINPPHTAIGSRLPNEHLPPLGLLCIGGPLIDAGFSVDLMDAELAPMSLDEIVNDAHSRQPDIIMIGHSGSSSIHITVMELSFKLKQRLKDVIIIYGGVHPTYHWDEILLESDCIDIIVRGEGEKTSLNLLQALSQKKPLERVEGIAFRNNGKIHSTPPAPFIDNLDEYRVGWELIDHTLYSYWGGKRAVVVQFSRGCPHLCSYCGQRGFWTKYRHRDPVKFAHELAQLYREKGVEVINFADELPTGSRKAWKAFLEALIAENVPLLLVGSTRADDIVRDEDILHLYKQAGVIRFLLGIESYNEETLKSIQKGGNPHEDQKAIQLLRAHDIISMATYVIGFHEESDKDYWNSFKHLVRYDPDQIQLLYVVPHRWTPFYDTVKERIVLQPDTKRWDYKHQVLSVTKVPAWRVFLWFKILEALLQLRPKVLFRLIFHRDRDYRYAMRWYTRIGRRVWLHEIHEFLFHTKLLKNGPLLKDFMGLSLSKREYVHKDKRS
jgi:anaerobic magnesium-protoporphyrin IX monomethyl ester cyclase